MKEFIYSRNGVYEALQAGRRDVFRLVLAEGSQEKGRLIEIIQFANERRIPIEKAPRARLEKISPNHQGVALEVSGYPYSALVDMLDLAQQREEPPFLLLLDTLQDPQNLATLLRTAEICGVHGILLPLRQTAGVTPAVVNASSGASEHLLVAQANLAQAISEMKENDIWVAGLDGGPQSRPLSSFRLDGPLALVVGNEGEGMRPLVRQSCDVLLRLDMRGQVESLNAAVAGSIAIYLAMQARQPTSRL